MAYATEHADALADVRAAGAPVVFTESQMAIDDETGAATETISTVPGHALRVKGRPDTYRALSLVESQAPTLLFVPDTYGAAPALGSSVIWNGATYTVRDVDPLAPDGTAILHRVVVAR